jgi:HYR domain protein
LRAGEAWDGKYEGRDMPTGDYWYIVELTDEFDTRIFNGNFTLYR